MTARPATIDAHVHFTDFFQETQGIERLLVEMRKAGVARAVIAGSPLTKTWDEREPNAPRNFLDDDSRLYYYSYTDAMLASALEQLNRKDRRASASLERNRRNPLPPRRSDAPDGRGPAAAGPSRAFSGVCVRRGEECTCSPPSEHHVSRIRPGELIRGRIEKGAPHASRYALRLGALRLLETRACHRTCRDGRRVAGRLSEPLRRYLVGHLRRRDDARQHSGPKLGLRHRKEQRALLPGERSQRDIRHIYGKDAALPPVPRSSLG